MGQRSIDEQVALFVDEFRGHGRKAPAVKQVHEEGFEDIIAVMPQNDGGTAFFPGDAVEIATPETGTQCAIGPALRHLVDDDGVGVLILDPVRHAHAFEEVRQNRRRETRLPLIEVAGQQINRQQTPPLELVERGQKGVAVLPARQAHQPARPRLDHAVLIDGLPDLPDDPLAKLAEFGRLGGAVKQWVDIFGIIEHGAGIQPRPTPGKSGRARPIRKIDSFWHPVGCGERRQIMKHLILAAASALALTACTGKPSLDDPLLSDRELELEEFFDGRLVAQGQFQDIFGTVRRSFIVEIEGDWDGERLRLVEDFVYEDGATEQRIWTLRQTGPETWEGTAPGVIGVATGIEDGNRFNWRYEIDLPIPNADGTVETVRVTFDDWMWLQSDDRLLNRAYMQRWGVDVGEVIISFEKL